MVALVTLAEAAAHLRLDEIPDDLELKATAASAIVVDYIKRPDHAWDDASAPYLVKAAVLIMLARLFEDREAAGIPDTVKDLLWRFRDPAMA